MFVVEERPRVVGPKWNGGPPTCPYLVLTDDLGDSVGRVGDPMTFCVPGLYRVPTVPSSSYIVER